jgi:hypothetical protein
VPFVRQFFGYSAVPYGYLYFGQNLLGTKTVIRRIKDIISGSTPVIDTTGAITIDHSSHANQEIVDMVYRPDSGTGFYIYIAGKDDTDTWVYKFTATDASPSSSLIATNANFTQGLTNQFLVVSSLDNNIYWIGRNRIDKIDSSDVQTTSALALGLPLGTYATAGIDWQKQLVIAFTNTPFGSFSLRNYAGKSGIAIWDYLQPAITSNIPAPCRYISALVHAPDGQLLVFGGSDEGKSSIYIFTGYGFELLTQYIGDMPRSRHSVEFDGQGRIVFLTADGFYCRYDRSNGKFENLGRTLSTGGLLAKGIGSPIGNDFFVGSGMDSTYKMQIIQFGSYIGDDAGADETRTPMVASGSQVLGEGSTIEEITLPLAKPLQTGERVELRVYKNGSATDYDTYLTMDFDDDGAISSKREVKTLDNINSYNLVVVFKMTDGNSTAPPCLPALVGTEDTH